MMETKYINVCMKCGMSSTSAAVSTNGLCWWCSASEALKIQASTLADPKLTSEIKALKERVKELETMLDMANTLIKAQNDVLKVAADAYLNNLGKK